MKGWILSDAEGNAYTFLELSPVAGGNVMVNTRMGQDGSPAVNQLYWGKLKPIWTVGERPRSRTQPDRWLLPLR